MRALLDVNVLIAILDSAHIAHVTAITWLRANAAKGWASCPITQNGCLRIMSAPRYPAAMPVREVATRLREATARVEHEFWPDSVSLLNELAIDTSRVLGPGQLTDIYLLALAVSRDGYFVTLDESVTISAVRGAQPSHLLVL